VRLHEPTCYTIVVAAALFAVAAITSLLLLSRADHTDATSETEPAPA
jgi:hypothetical protein